MPFTFTANPVESLVEAQLNFEQIAAMRAKRTPETIAQNPPGGVG